MCFRKGWSTLQTMQEPSHCFTLTTANSIQWPPSPLGTIQKVTIFFYISPRPLHWWKQAKPTLCVCLPEKIASFIYRPLALFSQWIPGLNVISQETLPMCSPVIPHCLQAESSMGGGTQHCQPSHKNSQTLVWLYWEAMDVLQSVSTQQETRGAWGLRKEVYNFKQCKLNFFFWRRMKSLKN